MKILGIALLLIPVSVSEFPVTDLMERYEVEPFIIERPEMIKASHIEELVVKPVLEKLAQFDPRLNNEVGVVLMMGTAAQETDLGYYLKQHPIGPGKGPWSVEDTTHEDVWRYLSRPSNKGLREAVLSFARDKTLNPHPPHDELIDNLAYSCAIARVKYWMVPAKLPASVDLHAIGAYWDKYYNANARYGTVDEFVASYREFVL